MSRLRANVVVNKDANGPFEAGEGINVAASKNIKFQSGSSLADSNNNEYLKFSAVVSGAVNEITISNAIAAGTPTISATGNDTNISLDLISKGTGTVKANGVEVVTLTGSQTLAGKTLTAPVLNTATINNSTLVNPTFSGVTLVTISGVETLTNKTLTSPIISTISNTGTLTLPTTTDTLVGRQTTDTLTNKTLTTPKIDVIRDTGNSNSMTINSTDVSFSTAIKPFSGSTSVAPILFTSGTLLTTQTAGAVEYANPNYFFGLDASSGRAWNQAVHLARLNASRTKTANTTLEAIFPVGDRTLTLAANTLYYFRAYFDIVTISNGVNAHQAQFAFAFTNAPQSIYYNYLFQEGTASTTTQTSAQVTSTTAITVGTSSIAAKQILIQFEGWFSSNATTGGTFTPQYAQTIAGATSAQKDSWIMVQPLGSPTTTKVGNWS